MTVHTPNVPAHQPWTAVHAQQLMAFLAIAAVILLFAIVMIVVFSLIGPPGQDVPAIERLSELRNSIGGGGFI